MSTHSPLPPFIINCLDLYDDTFTDDRLGIILVLWCASILYYYSNVADAPCDLTRKISESGILLFIELHPYYRSFAEYTEMVESPEILPASCLCYLIMMAFNIPVDPPLFMTMGNLVTLSLDFDTLWFHIHPNALLRQFPFLPQLEEYLQPPLTPGHQ